MSGPLCNPNLPCAPGIKVDAMKELIDTLRDDKKAVEKRLEELIAQFESFTSVMRGGDGVNKLGLFHEIAETIDNQKEIAKGIDELRSDFKRFMKRIETHAEAIVRIDTEVSSLKDHVVDVSTKVDEFEKWRLDQMSKMVKDAETEAEQAKNDAKEAKKLRFQTVKELLPAIVVGLGAGGSSFVALLHLFPKAFDWFRALFQH